MKFTNFNKAKLFTPARDLVHYQHLAIAKCCVCSYKEQILRRTGDVIFKNFHNKVYYITFIKNIIK